MLVFAHAIVGRADLPIPVWLFGVAAAIVLVVSFLALAAGWSRPRLERVPARALVRIPFAVEVVLGALGVFVFAVTVYAGLVGVDSQADNLAPTAVYVGFWIGVPFVTLLFGNVFRLLSPWRAIGRFSGWLAGRLAPAAMPEPLPYPDRLGNWPAVAGILGFIVCELCWAAAKDPGPLAIIVLVYLAIQLVGMSLYGVEAWTRRGDAFGVWFGLLARLSPVGRRADGRLVLRPPVAMTTQLAVGAGTSALLLVGIGSTAFDGAREGPLFNGMVGDVQDAFTGIGASMATGLELGLIAGLLVSVAAAYLVAHYFSALAYNGQALWHLASDPLGDGSDLFGGASSGIDYSIVSATQIWNVQVAALVVGHVAGLVLAHDRALSIYGSPRSATGSQIVMLAVMVMFTILGLWLLSAALNQ